MLQRKIQFLCYNPLALHVVGNSDSAQITLTITETKPLIVQLRDEELQLISLPTEGRGVNLHGCVQNQETSRHQSMKCTQSRDSNTSSVEQSPSDNSEACKLAWTSSLQRAACGCDVR